MIDDCFADCGKCSGALRRRFDATPTSTCSDLGGISAVLYTVIRYVQGDERWGRNEVSLLAKAGISTTTASVLPLLPVTTSDVFRNSPPGRRSGQTEF